MASVKRVVLDAIEQLPETAGYDEIMYQLYVMQKVEAGRDAARRGDTLNVDELRKEMEAW